MRCVRSDGEAAVLTVRLTPRADRDAVEGIADLADGTTVLKARVRAVPEDGAATAALIRLLAKILDLPKSRLTIVSGATQRVKHIRVGVDAESLSAMLQASLKA